MISTTTTFTPDLRSQLPHGVQDCFLVDAARRRRAEAALCECFARWGYQEVIPPSFEYYENLSVGASAELQQAMYRFLDREGHTLALRADFTPQVARMVATKLFDQPMPLRYFYVGSLFRYEEPQAGRKREFTQAGVELIGADTPAADASVVALAIAALEALELRYFQVNLGQMAFFRALTDNLSADALDCIREAIDHKNSACLRDALTQAGVTGKQRDLLRRLPDLVGGPEVLDEARALSAGLARASGIIAAIERLAQVYRLLQAYGVADRVILDLGEVRGMDYYTGITFRGVAPGLGWPVISGGRYDDLIARFGRPLAAVGFGLGIERALLVQSQQGSLSPHVLVRGCDQVDPLTIALPKGRLLEPAADLFRRLGWRCDLGNGSRQLLVTETNEANGAEKMMRFLLVKPADVPVYVEYGAADLGIVGQDVLWESGRDVYEPLQLGFGRCRLVLAGTPSQRGRDFCLATGLRVATKYPRLARAYFQQRGLSVEVIPLAGSIELAPLVGLADLLVDIVETGRTLRENGLVELEEIAACQATLIVNRVVHRLRLAETRQLIANLQTLSIEQSNRSRS